MVFKVKSFYIFSYLLVILLLPILSYCMLGDQKNLLKLWCFFNTSGYPRASVNNFDIKKIKKNNTGIGPVKWNCLVYTNKIVPKKKRKGRKKKRL
jgi:hypothetical protein